MLRISNKNKAFTLIEILVVIVIIGILTAIAIPNYQSAQKNLALQRSAVKLTSDIRKAQEMAMSAKECTHPNCPSPPEVPEGGYGVYFEEGSGYNYTAKIYADISAPNEIRNSNGNEDIGDISLEKEVYISDVNTSPNKVSINFKPPDPTITMKWEGGETNVPVTITLCIKGTNCLSSDIKTITVNKVGLVDVD